MPPQPFSSIVGTGETMIQFSARGTVRERPILTAKVAEIIAVAAEIDTQLGDTLTAMLGAEAKPALAIYSVLRAAHIQSEAMMAAAAEVLDERMQMMLESVLRFATSAMADRHKLAHWHWGFSYHHPDLMLLRRPEDKRAQDRWIERIVKLGSGKLEPGDMPDTAIELRAILAYREHDLDEVIDRLSRVRRSVAHLHKLISPETPKPADELWRELLSVPELAEGLARCEEKRKTT